ncbi:MAG: type 1 glutamine amidotransferase [Nevskia sp.]|nr:type 1 glutamine amidotransferase [Nevskia sp.]
MRVHWLQHADFEDLGCIAPWLAERGHEVAGARLYAGEAPPAVRDFDALVVMGGPMNIYEYERHPWLTGEKALIRAAVAAGKRVLGVCLGAQLIADVLGGPVTRNRHSEIGWFPVTLTEAGRASPWFTDLPQRFTAFHWHGDTYALPPGARCLAASEACPEQAFAYGTQVLGLQFHLEVSRANAEEWFRHERPQAAAYVQEPDHILAQPASFEENNRLMRLILERFFAE